ncbi:unnamed protein product [Adineta ricciae]|uniref:Uncharacterized protein n=1 Tax=Adineta ricciae TaxID=249248 RepID=A0A815UDG9_ADIRI|nr:unnamed protein product [Adineta ricciae]
MAKFLSRLFRSSSLSKNESFRSSQGSLNDNSNRARSSSNIRTTTSLENFSSYQVTPKELEKNKLHKASWEGNLNKVVRLAQPGQINVKDQQQRTPLHLAVVKGHLEIVKHLVQEGARLNVVDSDQRTPLIKAVLSGSQNPQLNYQICQVLINGDNGAAINHLDKLGRSALHYAIDYGNEGLVNLLLSNENCDPNLRDQEQRTPLHLAIKRNSLPIVRALLSDDHEQQADPNQVDRNGQTPLHIAASVGYVEIVRLLLVSELEEPCDPSIVDSQQLTALHLAKSNHQEGCANLIEEYLERWYKKSPRRPATASIPDQVSVRGATAMSMHPAPNLQGPSDDTSDDSSSVSTRKPSKIPPRQVTQRPSDQWSDENGGSASIAKPESHGLIHLFKSNPLQTERVKTTDTGATASVAKSESHGIENLLKSNPLQTERVKTDDSSILSNLMASNPLQTDTKKLTSTTQLKHPPSSFFGIGPVVERVGSDNTSTSISVDQSVIPATQVKPSTTTMNTAVLHRTVSNTRSWSDDTITAPVVPPLRKSTALKKLISPDDSWGSLQSDDEESVPKPKSAISALQKTLPFSPTASYGAHSDSEEDSVETEIRKLDLQKASANGSTVQALVNKSIGNGYKVIGVSEVHSALSDDSSWTPSPAPLTKEPATKGVASLVQKVDDSTWDDSRPLSVEPIEKSVGKSISSLVSNKPNLSEPKSSGVENLTKMMASIMHPIRLPSTSPQVIGKLIVSPLVGRTDSALSENTLHEVDDDDDDDDDDYESSYKKRNEKLLAPAPIGQDFKTLQHLARTTLPADRTSLRDSISSTKSSIHDINELKENIRRLERQQEDAQELKRQLKEMENKKNAYEKRCQENDQMLRDIEVKLQLEKTEKQRLESTTKDLNIELRNIKQQFQRLEDEKDSLNQRFINLQEERDNHNKKVRLFQAKNSRSTSSSSTPDDDNDVVVSRRHEEMKSLSAAGDDLHHRAKQFQADVQLHKESVDLTKRYQIDLEKALEEKLFFQEQLDRLTREKSLVEQERLEYKSKYDSLQDEIRLLLSDRAKLEQTLTGELQEHIQEKQRSTDDIKKYRQKIDELNMKLGDAESRLMALQAQNETLLTSKDRQIKDDYESLAERLNKTESEQIHATQRYHNQHNELTNKQRTVNGTISAITSTPIASKPPMVHQSISTLAATTPLTPKNAHQHTPSLSCTNCHALQRSYEQERASRLHTEQDNQQLRETLSHHGSYQHLNRTYAPEQPNENYLLQNSRQIRSDTERVKFELDRLRQDFDKLVANYEPTNSLQHQAQLHSQIDTFRHFYEQEFRQRQATMAKITAGVTPARTIVYHRNSPASHYDHAHVNGAPCSACINSRVLKGRLETAIDSSLAEQRLQTIKQTVPLPRQASALLTINTTNHGLRSSVEILRSPDDI